MIALVTGGASSGKSSYAEQICTTLGGDLVYLATMRPIGEEGARRVRKHRAARAGKGFRTVECCDGLDIALNDGGIEGSTVLLECLGNVVANDLFGDEALLDRCLKAGPGAVCESIQAPIDAIAGTCAHLIVVGNEVFSDGCDYERETVAYQEVLGMLTNRLAASSDLVVECHAGEPLVLKASGNPDVHAALGKLPVSNGKVKA